MIENIVKLLEMALASRGPGARTYADYYEKCCALVSRYGYRPGFIPNFCLYLKKYQGMQNFGGKAGFFLNALINQCIGRNITVVTSHLEVPLYYIGYRNSGKSIAVKGNLGASTGQEMKKGSIHVVGSVDSFTGELMEGGEIVVEYDAGPSTGYRMRGGIIRVNGELGEMPGSDMEGGRIYHKGKLIARKNAFIGKIRRLVRKI
jgi:hypothetical protein